MRKKKKNRDKVIGKDIVITLYQTELPADRVCLKWVLLNVKLEVSDM